MSFHSEKDEINYEEYVDKMLLQYITTLIICNQYVSFVRTDLSRINKKISKTMEQRKVIREPYSI